MTPVGASSSPHVRYYGRLHGIPVAAVSPHYTTQDCSGCGIRVKKSLCMRTHICPNCGLVLDRDWNAALNILLAALAWVAAHRTAGQVETGRGSRAAQRFWTEDHKPARATASRQVGWLKEESPRRKLGGCQDYILLRGFVASFLSTCPEQAWVMAGLL